MKLSTSGGGVLLTSLTEAGCDVSHCSCCTYFAPQPLSSMPKCSVCFQFCSVYVLLLAADAHCLRSRNLQCSDGKKPEELPAWQVAKSVTSVTLHSTRWHDHHFEQHHVFWKTSLCQTLEAEEVLCQQSQQRITATKVYMSFSQCILTLTIRHRRSWQHPLSASIMEGGWIWLVLVIAKSWKTYLCYCNLLYTYASLLPHRPWPVIPFS